MASKNQRELPKRNGVVGIKVTQTFFAFFWALAMFFNGFRQGIHLNAGVAGFVALLIFATSTLLLMKPSSTKRLLYLSGLGTIEFFIRLPQMPNHFFILGVVNIAVLVSILFQRGGDGEGRGWFFRISPFLRLCFVAIYGFAAIAKLNSGFFGDESSCAYVLANKEFAWLGLDWDFTRFAFFPYFIAGTELFIFLCLTLKKCWPYAVAVASLFHTSLSLTPVSQGLGFTFVLVALLSLFVSEEAVTATTNFVKQKQLRVGRKVPMDLLKYLFCACAAVLALSYLVVSKSEFITTITRWLLSLLVLSITAIFLAVVSIKYRNTPPAVPQFKVRGFIEVPLALAVFLTGFSPYLGLKTRPAFTMYSNLVTEDNKSNHFLIPRLLKDNFADDLVTILSSSDPELQADAQRGVRWVYLELQKRMKVQPNTRISFERDGKLYELNRAAENPELIQPNPLLAKFLAFRKVYPYNYCSW